MVNVFTDLGILCYNLDMFNKSFLKTIILDQHQTYKLPKNYIRRDLQETLLKATHKETIIITGLRRVGKSTLLLALKQHLGGKYFINFDDERLIDFKASDFQVLLEVFLELFGDQNIFYFDEIQNIKGWERFVRRLYDMGKRIIITGSNANLLSLELGTHLTGRYIPYELFPLSFKEFLRARKKEFNVNFITTKEKVELLKEFQKYLTYGGIPQYVLSKEPLFLQQLVQDVVFRDVIRRYAIKKIDSLDRLVKYAFSNFSRLISVRRIAPIIGVGGHPTVSSYLKYLEQAYLLFTIPKYAYSVKNQYLAPKKLYVIDLALAKYYGFSFSENIGHMLENLVFLQLRRNARLGDIFYFSNNLYECDFIVQEKGQIAHIIQVTQGLNEDNKKREVRGLIKAMKYFGVKKGTIITFGGEETIKEDNFIIEVVPIYKWLLANS